MQKNENCQETVKSKGLRTVTGIGKVRELRETMEKCEKCKQIILKESLVI